jgi:hypothetical protein
VGVEQAFRLYEGAKSRELLANWKATDIAVGSVVELYKGLAFGTSFAVGPLVTIGSTTAAWGTEKGLRAAGFDEKSTAMGGELAGLLAPGAISLGKKAVGYAVARTTPSGFSKIQTTLSTDELENAWGASGGPRYARTFSYSPAGEGEYASIAYETPSTSAGSPYWGSWSEYPKVLSYSTRLLESEDYALLELSGTNEYALVGERLYSSHAVNRMLPSGFRWRDTSGTGGFPQIQIAGSGKPGSYDYGRSVAPGFIESVIGEGRPVTQSNGNILYTSGSVDVILSPEGRVVTVITQH